MELGIVGVLLLDFRGLSPMWKMFCLYILFSNMFTFKMKWVHVMEDKRLVACKVSEGLIQ